MSTPDTATQQDTAAPMHRIMASTGWVASSGTTGNFRRNAGSPLPPLPGTFTTSSNVSSPLANWLRRRLLMAVRAAASSAKSAGMSDFCFSNIFLYTLMPAMASSPAKVAPATVLLPPLAVVATAAVASAAVVAVLAIMTESA